MFFLPVKVLQKRMAKAFFYDGNELVRKFPSRVLKAFSRRKLHYSLAGPPEILRYWLKKDDYTDDDLNNPPEDYPFKFSKYGWKIFSTYGVPVLHKPIFFNKLSFGNFLLFARYIHDDKWFLVYEDGTIVPDKMIESVKKTVKKLSEYN